MRKFILILVSFFMLNVLLGQDEPPKAKPISELEDLLLGKGNRSSNSNSTSGGSASSSTEVTAESESQLGKAFSSMLGGLLSDVVFVLKQDYYAVDDKGKKFGINKGVFGSAYGIGVASQGKFWTTKSVKEGWGNDPGFQNDKVERNFVGGALSDFYYKNISGKGFKKVKDAPSTIAGNLATYDVKEINSTISTTKSKGGSSGFLVIYHTEKNVKMEEATIYSEIIELSPDWKDGQSKLEGFNLDARILGGIFVVQEISVGMVKYKVSGLLEEKEGEYHLYEMPLISGSSETTIISEVEEEKKKKGKKETKKGRKERRNKKKN